MPRYLKFEKPTSRGTLGHDVALDGLVVRQRVRRGVNKKTGKVGGGSASSTSTFTTAKKAQAAFDKIVKDLLAERFTQVGGPPARGEAPRPVAKRFTLKGKASPSSVTAIAAFEKKYGVELPKSYRAFVTKYGAGELLEFVRIHAPASKGSWKLEHLMPYANELGILPFATTAGGDTFGWKLPSDAVHYIERNDERPKKVAPSFDAFVKGLTTSQRFVEKLFPGLDADATFTTR